MIRRREGLFLLLTTMPITGHVLILPLLWDIAGRDAWISTLLAAPFGILIATLTWKLLHLQPDTTLRQLSKNLWGPVFGLGFNLIWLLYFSLMAIITLTGLLDMMQGGFYQETPLWFIGIAFTIFIIYCSAKGIKVIAWIAGGLVLVLVLSGHAISLLLSPMRDFRQLLPHLEFGWNPVFLGTILLCAVWSEMFTLAVMQIRKAETKGMLYLLLLGSFANTMTMLSVAAGTVTIFGWEQTDTLLYPVLSSVRMVTLGFMDRFDIYGIMLMTFGSFIRQAFFLHAMIEMLPFQKLISKHRTITNTAVMLLIYILALMMFRNKLVYESYMKNYVLAIFLWPIPLLYILKHWWGKRKKSAPKPPLPEEPS